MRGSGWLVPARLCALLDAPEGQVRQFRPGSQTHLRGAPVGSPPIKTAILTPENLTHKRRVGALQQQGRLSSFRGTSPNFAPCNLGSRTFPIL